ncbi:MAG TPA: type IX secretion system protein PorQ [Bacteroidia bacterium]|nr:type IX secretion system protein PorQ [Bacteroidia bacterium]
MRRLLGFCLLLNTLPAFAQIGGTSIYEFLNLSNSARASSLGGTVISIQDHDLNLAVINPALLDSTLDNQLALNYTKYLPDVNINYGFVSYAKHFKDIGTFDANLQYINYGRFKETDVTGVETGSFSAADYSFNVGYGKPLGKPDSSKQFSVGANVKFISSQYYNFNSTGAAADIGINFLNIRHNLSASILVRNMGRQFTDYVSGNAEPLPFEILAGISFKPKHAPFRLTVTGTHLETWDLTYIDPANPPLTTDPLTGQPIIQHPFRIWSDKLMRHLLFGGEVLLSKNFNIRLGYNYERREELMVQSRRGLIGMSFGFGFRIYKFHFSYGHAAYHIAGGSNTFSITTNLSDFYSSGK